MEKRTHPLVKAVVLFHLLAMISWSMPRPIPPVQGGIVQGSILDQIELQNERYLKPSPIQQYVQSLGLFSSWDMFAPDPTNRNIWGDAEVEYEDGTRKIVPYPRIATYSVPWKVQKERYRKYYERAHHEEYADRLWPSFGQRMGYLAAESPSNPPRLVRLRRHIKITPPPLTAAQYFEGVQKGVWLPPSPDVSGEFPTEVYFEWVVNQEQLFRDKGWKL